MKKILLTILLAIHAFAMADGRDLIINQRNADDTGNILRVVASPVTDGLFYYNTTTLLPGYVTLGAGLSISSGVLSASAGTPQVQTDWNASSGLGKILNRPTIATVGITGQYADLTGAPSIPAAQVASDWSASSGVSAILNKPTTLSGYGISDGVTSASLASSLSGYATTSALTTGLAGKFANPSGTTAQYVRGDGTLATLPTAAAPSQGAATRTLNSAFQISTTRNTLVSYSVQLTVTASLSGGQNGDVILEIASDSGFTTNVQTIAITGLGQTYTLAVALQGVQPQTGVVSGYVPASYYARLRTVNNTGTPTYSYRAGQEIQL